MVPFIRNRNAQIYFTRIIGAPEKQLFILPFLHPAGTQKKKKRYNQPYAQRKRHIRYDMMVSAG
jgi:hypothetical protein